MRLTVLEPNPTLPVDLDDGDLAERLRSEAEALGVTIRRLLLQRVRAARPGVCPERLRKILHAMFFLTDLAGGVDVPAAAPAPLRAVSLAGDAWLLVGGPRTSHLEGEVRAPFLRVLMNASPDALARLLEPHRGSVLQPDLFWESTTPLDAAWLASHRQTWELGAVPTNATEEAPWKVYDPSRPCAYHEGRWRGLRQGDQGFALVRRQRPGERPAHAWGLLSGGQVERTHPLPSGLACDARYALDRAQGFPVRGLWSPADGNRTELYPDSWLPRTEHRLLRSLARRAPAGSYPNEPWILDSDLAELVRSAVSQRLGMRWEEGQPCPTA
ncbi:MAG: hypothetical protein AMXMBFR33_17620 [Candidatus Xenobia bacterium]